VIIAGDGCVRNLNTFFHRDNRVALSRLREFVATWEYMDGIVSGVVMVGTASYNAKPYWYHCVYEDIEHVPNYMGDRVSVGNWYRRFILLQMTEEKMRMVVAQNILKNTLSMCYSVAGHHATGMPLLAHTDEFELQKHVCELLGDVAVKELKNSFPLTLHDISRAGFHIGKLEGWFQR